MTDQKLLCTEPGKRLVVRIETDSKSDKSYASSLIHTLLRSLSDKEAVSQARPGEIHIWKPTTAQGIALDNDDLIGGGFIGITLEKNND